MKTDKQAIEEKVCKNCIHYQMCVDIFFPALYKNELDEMPTADVVPRIELDAMRLR